VNKHSIIPTPHITETAAVAVAYAALEVALFEAQAASALVKEANGSLCESADFIPNKPTDDERRRMEYWQYQRALRVIQEKTLERSQRRITLYGCKLRFLGTIEVLGAARQNLMKAVDALRAAIDANTDPDLRLQLEAARCNVVFADALLSTAREEHRNMRKASDYGLHPHEHYPVGIGKVDLGESLSAEYDRSRREWVVMSSGHGSKFRFDGGDGSQVPEGPYLTYDEAAAEGAEWESMADTIGGRACLYNVRTKQEVGSF
jgi:hypothetical protein